MGSIFEKLGIYDFMGIWAPGAISVTYYLLSFYEVINKFISENGISEKYAYILLYTAIAYILGVIFHEIGKIVVDYIQKYFDTEKYTLDYNKGNFNKKPRSPFLYIKYDFQKRIRSYNIEPKVSFEEALSVLRNSDLNIGRINAHHSIYALSRGCFIGIVFHIIVLIILLIIYICGCIKQDNCKFFWWFIPDAILGFIFFLRSYRYFVSWIKNTYIQYYFYTKKVGKK